MRTSSVLNHWDQHLGDSEIQEGPIDSYSVHLLSSFIIFYHLLSSFIYVNLCVHMTFVLSKFYP